MCNRIFLLDGNLSDIYVNFVAKIAKNKRVIKIENQKKIPPHNVKFIVGIDPEGEIKRRDKSALVRYICSEGVKPWIACDSKEFSKVLDRLLKDLGRFGFCLNSETAGEDWAKEFMQSPNLFIESRKPDYMIVSPTAESGVSVTAKHFTDKMTFFVGVQRFYFVNTFEISQKRHEVDWFYQATAEDFFSARMKKISHLDIWALKKLNVLQFTSGEWHKDMPEVIAFIKEARSPEIVNALNMSPKPDSAKGGERIEYISKLLKLMGLKFAEPEQRMIDGIRQRVYTISSEVMDNPNRLAVLAAVEKKMDWWMSEKSQVDWSEQPLEQTTAQNSTLHTTPPTYINQGGGVQPENSEPQTEIGTSTLHTTPSTYINQGGGVQPENPEQEPVKLSEWMTVESLQCIAGDLEIVATTDDSQGMEMLKDIRDCMPPEALKVAVKLLPKPLWNRISEMVKLQDFPVKNQQQSKEALIEKLLKISDWAELGMTQAELGEIWPLLSESQRSHLWELQREYQQQLSIEQLAQEAIATQAEIKERGFGFDHFRSYVIKAVCNGVAIVRKCWGDKQECEIELNQLLFTG